MARLEFENKSLDPQEKGDGESVSMWNMGVLDGDETDDKYVVIALDRPAYNDIKALLEQKIEDKEFIAEVTNNTSVFFNLTMYQARVLGKYLISISKGKNKKD